MIRYLIVVLLGVTVGYASRSWVTREEQKLWGPIVESSASYQRAKEIDSSRVIWLIEGREPECSHAYVGFDMGTHTCREATLRVYRDGRVERQEMREDGELVWVADK